MIIVSTVVTAIRNLALVVFTVEVCLLAWRMLGAGVMEKALKTPRLNLRRPRSRCLGESRPTSD